MVSVLPLDGMSVNLRVRAGQLGAGQWWWSKLRATPAPSCERKTGAADKSAHPSPVPAVTACPSALLRWRAGTCVCRFAGCGSRGAGVHRRGQAG